MACHYVENAYRVSRVSAILRDFARGNSTIFAMIVSGRFISCLLLTSFLAGRILGSAIVNTSFEEDARPAAPARYFWHNSQVLVRFQDGGKALFSTSGGEAAAIAFPGANRFSQPHGESPTAEKTHYYVGPAENWRSDSHFERVRYSRIYPGIDLVFLIKSGELEYNFEISPGADPSVIRIHYERANPELDRNGELRVKVAGITITQRRPRAFEKMGERARPIECSYVFSRNGDVVLATAAYDHRASLLIDPVLIFSTYLGGPGFDAIYGVASDTAGNLYVTGETDSSALTSTAGAPRSSRDVFVTKMNSAGTQLLYTVYLGGGGNDSGKAIAVDASGNAYITGVTSSQDFPVTGGTVSSRDSGAEDAFVSKLDSNGHLVYSTYLGGERSDYGFSIAVDAAGDAYVAGQTGSTAFPVTAGAFQTSNRGGLSDCFISKLNPAASALLYSTLVGGAGIDLCAGLTIDSAGNAYVTGTTYSSDLPTRGALQASLRGAGNAFVAKINPGGSALVYSTFLGGSSLDNGSAIAVDASGSAYVTGYTSSVDFPTTAGAAQTSLTGSYNAFVSKLSADGSTLAYATLLGGTKSDAATSIAVDQTGRAIVGGYTSSPDFPVVAALQSSFQGAFDAFATVVDANGASFVFSSLFGGPGDDRAYAVAALAGNNLFLAGMTASTSFPAAHALQNSLGGEYDAFGLEVNYAAAVPAVSVTPSSGSGSSQTFVFQFTDGNGFASINSIQLLINGSFSGANGCLLYFYPQTNQLYMANDSQSTYTNGALGSSITLQNSQCSLNLASSSAAGSGNNLSVSLAVSFKPAFVGATSIYAYVLDTAGASSGWKTLGAYTVTQNVSQGPQAVSVSPSSGSGSSQTFTFQLSDGSGSASISSIQLLINGSFNGSNGCFLYFYPQANQIYLANDSQSAYSNGALGSSISLQNSQCSLNLASSSASGSGNNLSVSLATHFQGAFAGAKSIYAYVLDAGGASSGWKILGTYTVIQNLNLGVQALSVSPASGNGSNQTFAFQFSDGNGSTSISSVQLLVNATLSGTNACFVYFYPQSNQLYLANDSQSAYSNGALGTSVSLQNSQCSLNLASSSASGSGNNLNVSLAVNFKPAFAGAKSLYAYALDAGGPSSGWQTLGTYTVSGNASLGPQAVSVTPASGSGSSQAFAFQFSDGSGSTNISSIQVLINGSLNGSNACSLYLYPQNSQISLANDAQSSYTNGALGSSTTLQNSQCSLNLASSSASSSGNNLNVTLAVNFKPAFAGAKSIYSYVLDTAGPASGWQTLGTYTVSGNASQGPQAVSVTPSSGSGSSQTFAFQFTDSNGFTSIDSLQLLINGSFSGANGCLVYFYPKSSLVYLANDAQNSYADGVLGGSATLQNSQCSLNLASSSASASGNNLSVNVAVSFASSFGGTKGIYTYVLDSGGQSSGWQTLGAWTVP